MKFAVGLALIVSTAVAASQVWLLGRIASLESRLQSRPGADGAESVDRRLESLRLAVAALSAAAVTNSAQPAVTEPVGGPAPAVAKLTSAEPVSSARPSPAAGKQPPDAEETEIDDDPVPAAALAANQAGGPPAPALERRRLLLEQIRTDLSRLDRNGDRKLSLAEYKGDLSDFLYFDRDSNGSITVNEVERVLAVEEKAAERVAAGDADRDGALAPAEFKGSPRLFRFIDENADGRIVPEELVSQHRRVNQRFSSEDVDNDRKISPAEFGGGAARFEKFDKNKDGFLSRSELKDMLVHGQ